MNFWDKVVGFFSARQQFTRTQYRTASSILSMQARKYEGASAGRRTKNWIASSSSAAAEVETSIVTLRNRARQLVRDNPYAAKGLQAITANVVGWGIIGQIKVDSPQKNTSGQNASADKRTRELAASWKAWAESTHCDFDGRNNFYGLQRLIMRGVAESGEILIRRRRVERREVIGPDGRKLEIAPLALQVLEGDFLSINRNWAPIGDPTNIIIDGIEFDKYGKRVAYHMFEQHPGNAFSMLGTSLKNNFKVVRIPAEDIIHVFRLDRPGQIRGASWFAPIMLRLRDFDEYEDAQLVRQKVAAMFAVFVKDLDGVDSSLTSGADAELGEKVEPGIIEILPPGKDITLANPPTVQGYGEYSSNVLHAIAAGLGITYEALTGDLSQVNFSSARMGFLEMNRNIEEWREDVLISQCLNPAFGWWKDSAELVGLDTSRARPAWTAPRREMVDPAKEVEATKNAIRSGLMTQSEAVRNQGYDPEQFFKEMAADNKVLDDLELILDTDPRNDPKRLLALNPANSSNGGGATSGGTDSAPVKKTD